MKTRKSFRKLLMSGLAYVLTFTLLLGNFTIIANAESDAQKQIAESDGIAAVSTEVPVTGDSEPEGNHIRTTVFR